MVHVYGKLPAFGKARWNVPVPMMFPEAVPPAENVTLCVLMVLFHVHEASYEEIAETLDVPIGTVMTWLHRGRKKLREALPEEAAR